MEGDTWDSAGSGKRRIELEPVEHGEDPAASNPVVNGSGEFQVTDTYLSVGQIGRSSMGCDAQFHAQDEWLGEFLQRGARLAA